MRREAATQKVSTEGAIPSTIVAPEQLYDPLLVLLKVKVRLNDGWIIMGMGVLSALGLFSWYFIGTLTLFQVLFGSVVIPLWMGIYLLLPTAISDLFNQLWENGVIVECRANRPGSMSYQEFVEKLARRIHSRWWAGIALFLLTLYWLYEFFFVRNSSIIVAPLWLRFIMLFVFSSSGYVGFLGIVWLLCIVVATNRLFHVFTIRVKPLHPDGSGGLGLFNRFLWISIALVAIGVCFTLGSRSLDVFFMLGAIVSYVIIVPLLLIAWLALPHHVMVQVRNELLQPITDEYERAMSETMPSANGDVAAIIAGTERLVALQKRYEQVRNSFATWPIEIVQLRRLIIVLILPVLLSLLPLLLDVLTKK